MAAVTQPISPSSRQPFAVLGESRLRAVESMKNKQNGISAAPLKRSYDTSNLSDSENVDPISKISPTKRSKNLQEHEFSKPTGMFHLLTQPTSLETPVRRAIDSSSFAHVTSIPSPRSAPIRAPAGRSPKSKIAKAFSRRSLGARTPIKPPYFTNRSAPRAPFSIAEALSGTFNTPLSKQARGSASKKSWNFDIHVDTEQDEMANLMEHSTCILDISDDEDKADPKDDRGKENIPPIEITGGEPARLTAPHDAAVLSRTVEMSDEPRSPLGELDPKNFIPDGVNASDAVLVLEDEQDLELAPKKPCSPLSITENAADKDEPSQAPELPQLSSHGAISDLIVNSAPAPAAEDVIPVAVDGSAPVGAEFDIWESGSATEEAAASAADC